MRAESYAAQAEDGQEILRILESSASEGKIELIYTRRPDAYASYQKEFGEGRVFVSRQSGRVVATCAGIIREVYIGGKPKKVAYICGLKKDAGLTCHSGFGAGFLKNLVRDDVDFYYCSVVADNQEAVEMFERSRRLLRVSAITEYTTYILRPAFSFTVKDNNYSFRQAGVSDEGRIIEFLNREGSKKDLFPVIKSIGDFYGLGTEDFYMLESGGKFLAVAALWNQSGYRQYVVKKYHGTLKYARLLSPLFSALGYVKLPKENQALNFPMLSFLLCAEDNIEYCTAFLNFLAKEIRKKYDMFAIGLSKNHFAAPLFRKLRSIHFDTRLYGIEIACGQGKPFGIDKDNIFAECGLL